MVCRGMDGDRSNGKGEGGKEGKGGEEGEEGERKREEEEEEWKSGKERDEKKEKGKRRVAYLSFHDIIEPLQQLNHGTLAASTGTHQRNCLPRFHCQTEVVQNLCAIRSQVKCLLVQGNTTLVL